MPCPGEVSPLWITFFKERVSLCSPDRPGTLYIDHVVLKLRDLPASTFQVLGLKVCASLCGLTSLACPHNVLVS